MAAKRTAAKGRARNSGTLLRSFPASFDKFRRGRKDFSATPTLVMIRVRIKNPPAQASGADRLRGSFEARGARGRTGAGAAPEAKEAGALENRLFPPFNGEAPSPRRKNPKDLFDGRGGFMRYCPKGRVMEDFLKRSWLPFAGLLLLAACASGHKGPHGGGPAMAGGGANGEAILAEARKARTGEGCAAAAPAYRVAAGMGAGFEGAQHELGECLIAMTGASPAETALFHDEGLFWLRRAAFAGNARAERALALFYGAANNSLASPAEALKWALVYQKNGDAELFGYQGLPPTFTPGLRAALPEEDLAAAEAFAASFAPITLAPYKAAHAKSEQAAHDAPPGDRPPPGGGRQRPRQ